MTLPNQQSYELRRNEVANAEVKMPIPSLKLRLTAHY